VFLYSYFISQYILAFSNPLFSCKSIIYILIIHIEVLEMQTRGGGGAKDGVLYLPLKHRESLVALSLHRQQTVLFIFPPKSLMDGCWF
jgi:hypothetical protein